MFFQATSVWLFITFVALSLHASIHSAPATRSEVCRFGFHNTHADCVMTYLLVICASLQDCRLFILAKKQLQQNTFVEMGKQKGPETNS